MFIKKLTFFYVEMYIFKIFQVIFWIQKIFAKFQYNEVGYNLEPIDDVLQLLSM